MYVQVDLATTPPTVSLEEPDDCKRFHLAVVNGARRGAGVRRAGRRRRGPARGRRRVDRPSTRCAGWRPAGSDRAGPTSSTACSRSRRRRAGWTRTGASIQAHVEWHGGRSGREATGDDGHPGAHRRPGRAARRVRRVLRQGVDAGAGAGRGAARLRRRPLAGPRRASASPTSRSGGQTSLADLAVLAEEFGRHLAPVPARRGARRGPPARTRRAGARTTSPTGETIVDVRAPRAAEAGVARLVPAGAVAGLVVALDGRRAGRARRAARARHRRASVASGTWARPRSPIDPSPTTLAGATAPNEPCSRRVPRRVPRSPSRSTNGACSPRPRSSGSRRAPSTSASTYVKARHQFGVPIGSFQSIQHKLADLAASLAGARLLARRAAADDRRDAARPDGVLVRGPDGRGRPPRQPPLPRRLRLHARVRRAAVPPAGQGVARSPSATLPTSWPSSPTGSTAAGWELEPAVSRAEPTALRAEVRAFLAEHCPPELVERAWASGTLHDWGLHRALGRAGLARRRPGRWSRAARPRPVRDGRDDRGARPGRRPDGRLGHRGARGPHDRPVRNRGAAHARSCRGSSAVRRSRASAIRNPTRGPTSRPRRPAPCATATTGS